MTRAFWIRRIIMALCIVAAGVTSWVLMQQQSNAVKVVQQMPVYNTIGDFALMNQKEQPVTNESMRGKVWMANFIFTRCGGPCPRMTNRMKSLQDQLADTDVYSVSFSVDPAYDTPARLKIYADKFKVDHHTWFFLTGEKEQIHRLSIQHFLLGVDEIPEEERERLDQGFNHSTKFALVDQEGQIRGYYDSEDDESMQTLMKHAKALAEVGS